MTWYVSIGILVAVCLAWSAGREYGRREVMQEVWQRNDDRHNHPKYFRFKGGS